MNYESWNNFIIEKIAVDLSTLRAVNDKLLGSNPSQQNTVWNPANNQQSFENHLHKDLKGMYGDSKGRSLSRLIAKSAVDSIDEDKSQSSNSRAKNYVDAKETPKQVVNDIRRSKAKKILALNREHNRNLLANATNSSEREKARSNMKDVDLSKIEESVSDNSVEKVISDRVQRRIDRARKKHPIIRIGSYRYKPGEEFMLEATKAHEISESRTPVLENYNDKTRVIKHNPGTVYSGLAVNSGHAGPQPIEDIIRASSSTGVGSKDYRKAEFARRTGDVQVMTNVVSDPKLKGYITKQYYGMDPDNKVFDKSVNTVMDQRAKNNQRLQDYIDKRGLTGESRRKVEARMMSLDPNTIRQELAPKRMNRNMKNHVLRVLDKEILDKPNLWKSTHKFDLSNLDDLKQLTRNLK
jgi:hypothetical protein